ncbi:Xaa-Pro aminopeptidase [Algoriphagus iocasae]|uniref:Xaa-Pro aminopeptidase n=1 Tax=Algoriphagus iocasae TaxID=1836499 RepID=A0A841MPE5_9BACT|nr:aminopeptidase P N-terminal domain-containing protein [Algoriphagus iocasae]MBB6324435.1 Xaa-Pro aminopeptidase [Algoriphagus iocasae]
MKRLFILINFLIISISSFAQSHFENALSSDWHKERRAAVRAEMPANSVAVVFNNPVKNRSNDVDYVYHPNTDFYYLTGLREPNAVLVIFSEDREVNGQKVNEMIYVQPRDPRSEMWNGKRLGVDGVKEKLGFENVFLYEEFTAGQKIDFSGFDKVLTFDLSEEIEGSSANAGLKNMVNSFKLSSGYPMEVSPVNLQMYELIRATDIENSANVAQIIGRAKQRYPEVEDDPVLKDFLNADSPEKRMAVKDKLPNQKVDLFLLTQIMDGLREIKTPEEQELMRMAAKISAIGQIEVMKAAKPGMSEREIQGIHEFIYKRYGAEDVGYPSIVGAGNNGCILHYIENDLENISDRLLLMDLGAEWKGYTADVTRTIPVNGKFNEEEKAIYELVLKSQDAGIALSKIGTDFATIGAETRRIIDEGLVELGIIKAGQRHNYFPHGTSHHVGLDVHDRGGYGSLKEGAIITVEPGIYIPDGSDCDKKWWGIAVRIEDDILVTSNGPVNLSGDAPRTVEAIEQMMRIPSVLENWVLPEIN